MLRFYRGHIIIVLVDERLSAEITDQATGVPFPIKVSASREEGEAIVVMRARELIDVAVEQLNTRGPALARRVA